LALDWPAGTPAAARQFDHPPSGLTISAGGERLIVTCAAPQSEVWVLAADTLEPLARIAAGHTASAPVLHPDGRRLFVCNRFDNDVSVIDLADGRELRRVQAVREPIAAALTPDGHTLVVANHLPDMRTNVTIVEEVTPEVTLIDTRTYAVARVMLPNGSHSLRDVCVTPDGRWALVTHLEGNFQRVPTRVDMGWINTNVVSVIDLVRREVWATIGLDEMDRGAANPWGVACTQDGRFICVTLAGTHELAVIRTERLLSEESRRTMSPMMGVWPIYLSLGASFWQRVPLPGTGPRAVATIGSDAIVAEYFSDTLACVPLERVSRRPLRMPGAGYSAEPGESPGRYSAPAGPLPAIAVAFQTRQQESAPEVRSIELGPAPRLTRARAGEILFHDGTICFQHWQSCASCHPDGRTDGLNWDLLNDGAGNPKNTKSLVLSHVTPPAMARGVRPDAAAAVRAGLVHILFAERPDWEAAAIEAYIESLRPVPSPHLVAGRLSTAAERGRQLFFSRKVGCFRCHPPPLYTDLRSHDVGTSTFRDREERFDTPTLIELWRTAPYLHDGRYLRVEELLSRGRHGLKHPAARTLSERDIKDLAAFVLSL
jgi:YVTN family beta-propeller protein